MENSGIGDLSFGCCLFRLLFGVLLDRGLDVWDLWDIWFTRVKAIRASGLRFRAL